MKKIVIASACRTAIGKFGGTLANVPAAELGSIVIKEALNRANVKPEQVDHVYMGCVIQAGLGQNVARQASLKAGLPIETPAVTVNVVCGSGLNCVNMAAQMIEAGDADIVVAGGMENMDMAPFAMMKGRYGYRMGYPMGKSELVDTMVNDALWDATGCNMHMGMTAENVCTNETYQKKYGYSPITREMLDEFSYHSQEKAAKAIADGAFKDEIVPVVIKGKKGDTVFDTDEGPRLSSMEVLGKLKPCFKKDGIVTAANSSAINDGAAALVVMSEEKAKELGVEPLATWVAGALAGVEPEVMGLGPIAATKKVMAKTGLTVDDMDLIEANEAFAAQSVAVGQALHFDQAKLNVNGGAIALGHPVGASGARILVTLLYAMKHRGAHKGLATLCIGGGMGCATIVEMQFTEELTMSFVTTEIQGAVAIVTIDRPKALNALNPEVLADLKAAFEAIDQNTVRCVVLTGAGDKSFVAGADIGSMSTMTKAEGEAFGKLGNDVFLEIESFPLPVIAAVNGFALGGGNELAMSCDIRICSDNAVFGQPEVGLGITPGFGGTQRLARLVGMGMAKQLVYSALNIKADEALRIGLVNAVYPQAELMENVMKLANKIAKNAPIAVRHCKKAINEGISKPINEAVAVEEKLFGDCFETHDQVEGMQCFLSREKPKPKAVFTNN